MVRKIIGGMGLLLVLVVALSACGGSAVDSRDLSTFKNAYTEAGYSIDNEGAPLFQIIGAKDGIMFDVENDVVKIYEYTDERTLDTAIKDNAMLEGFTRNGKFICETSDDELLVVFEAVEK